MAEVHGTYDPAFDSVRDLLNQRLSSGAELGASLYVDIDGKSVLDLWGGYADKAKTRPWGKDTVAPVWSCSKVITNLAALILIDRGLLDPNENAAKYWPEFAINGKDNIKVSHVLSHAAGLPAWEAPITSEDVYDWKDATERLANQTPWWTPGEGSGYHLITQGHLVGETIRRVTGKLIEQFVAEEITRPLGADFTYGLTEDQWSHSVDTLPPPPLPFENLDPNSITTRAIIGSPLPAELTTTSGFRKAVIPASNGFCNARGLARIGSMVSLGGTVENIPMVKPSTIDKLFEEQTNGIDQIIFEHVRFGLGVALADSRTRSWIPEGDICYWGGWGGSIIIMDRERRMTIGYAMNDMCAIGTLGNDNTEAYVKEIYHIVDQMLSETL
ncbi:uncharacterized protein N7483_003730 [Penicillium malachiteum]|uniref:uncharacterized protein n=1 Tax=Penicillium malachiteum TaxID=1324776 RepID=UPI0025490103|nr:uncharacterized protein N7483_003730 [Penicillium malachiteum]KAJ5729222.1 hypothetical protein N7483_003730 [Penicillium malachiteum]